MIINFELETTVRLNLLGETNSYASILPPVLLLFLFELLFKQLVLFAFREHGLQITRNMLG